MNIEGSLLENTDKLPEIIIPNNDTRQMLVNSYEFCRINFLDLKHLTNNKASYAHLYNRLYKDIYSLLDNDRDKKRPVLQRDVSELQKRLQTDNMEEALVRCAALLRALDFYLGYEKSILKVWKPYSRYTAAELGGTKIMVSQKAKNEIALRAGRLPRLNWQVSEMTEHYHPHLHITPAQIDHWSLVWKDLPRRTAEVLNLRVKSGQMKIAVSPLTADADLRGESPAGFPDDERAPFVLNSIGDEKPQIAFLQDILKQCYEDGISILVLPELRVPSALSQAIKDYLKSQNWNDLKLGKGLLMVVAGSWHCQDGKDWVNRSCVFDYRGNLIWGHDKLAEYEITADNVAKSPRLIEQLGINRHGGIEQIQTGRQLEFCDCALGRIAVAICVGFFHQPIERLLIASGATVFLVPTMTPDIRPLEKRAENLIRSQHASTFAANCGTTACDSSGKTSEKARSFYLLPHINSESQRMECPSVSGNYLHVFSLSSLTDA